MTHLGSRSWAGGLALAGLVGVSLSVLSAPPGRADTSPVPGQVGGRVVVTDLRPSSTDRAPSAPTDLDDAVAVATYPSVVDGVRGANLALRADGTVTGWGADVAGETRPPADLDGVVDVDLGGGFAVAARSDGSVVAWGGDGSGVTDVPADLSDVRAVAALGSGGCGFGIALHADGSLAQWGGASCADDAAYRLPEGLTDVAAVSAGDDAAIALRDDGTVVTWGPSGHLTYLDGVAPDRWTGVTQVSTQSRTFVGVTADHQTVAYGIWGEAGAPVGVAGVATASAGTTAAFLRTDGGSYLWPTTSTALPAPPYVAVEGGFGYVVTIVSAQPEPSETADPTPTSDPTPTDDPTPTLEPTATTTPTRPPCSPRPHHSSRPHHVPVRPAPRPTGTAGPERLATARPTGVAGEVAAPAS